jgi:GT2 family glycosyltransferase
MSWRRFDLGVVAYGQPTKLDRCLGRIRDHSMTDYRCYIVVNPHPDGARTAGVLEVAKRYEKELPDRFCLDLLPVNRGYAGGVNRIFDLAVTPYVGYVDHDAYIGTPGWDETLCMMFDQFHELALVLPNEGAYPIQRANYREILWAPGFCFVTKTEMAKALRFDELIGHQEEADFAQRVRMQGWKVACNPPVAVGHEATETNNPESQARINQGVINWVTKWNKYFIGPHVTYYSETVSRFEDWPPNAHYLEEYYKQYIGGLNKDPETIVIEGREFDLCKVPRQKGMYRGRIF